MGTPPVVASPVTAGCVDGVGLLRGGTVVGADDTLGAIHGYDNPDELGGTDWQDLYSTGSGEPPPADVLATVRETGGWRGSPIAHGRDGANLHTDVSMHTSDDGVVFVVRETAETGPGSGTSSATRPSSG